MPARHQKLRQPKFVASPLLINPTASSMVLAILLVLSETAKEKISPTWPPWGIHTDQVAVSHLVRLKL